MAVAMDKVTYFRLDFSNFTALMLEIERDYFKAAFSSV